MQLLKYIISIFSPSDGKITKPSIELSFPADQLEVDEQ
jgi:hypothetical protein